MSSAVIVLVLTAAALHASWNALLKGSRGKLLSATTMAATGGAVALLALPFFELPHSDAWKYLGLSLAIHVTYFLSLIASYRLGDLSQVYPTARGVGPILVALLSPSLLGEGLSGGEWLGIATICGGISLLAAGPFVRVELKEPALLDSSRRNPLKVGAVRLRLGWEAGSLPPLLFALITGGFIAAYTIVDGLGVRAAGSPISYILWLNFFEGVPLLVFALLMRRRELGAFLATDGKIAAAGGIIAALAYGLVLWAYSLGAIAPIAALRETSVLAAAWIGTRLMGEPFGRRRIAAAGIVAFGIFVLSLPR